MLDFDSLPPDVRRKYGRSLPRTVRRIEFPKGAILCEYCGSWVLEKEVHNGNCPNCAAPVRRTLFDNPLEVVVDRKVHIKTDTEQLVEGLFVKCPFCGTVRVKKWVDDFERTLKLRLECDCNRGALFSAPLNNDGNNLWVRSWLKVAAHQWEMDIYNRDAGLWLEQAIKKE